MTEETLAPPFEPETFARQHRLQRALTDPETLEEFLVNPRKIAERYEVQLSDPEIAAIRTASHFLASWDFFCGDGQWLDAALPNGRAPAKAPSIPEVVGRMVRARIAEEIVRDTPEAMHKVVSRVGSATLVDQDERLEDLPEHILPLARAIRRIVRTTSRELNRELMAVSLQGLLTQGGPVAGMHRSAPQDAQQQQAHFPHGNAVESLSMALGAYLKDVVNRAVSDAVDQVRPGINRPITRQTHRPRMEQPIA